MRVTSKGQVTIPINVREKLGIFPNTEVIFEIRGDEAMLRKASSRSARSRRGREIIERLRGTATVKMTTEEIMALTRGWGEDDDIDR